MTVTVNTDALSGVIPAIPSKSYAHRMMICAAFSEEPSRIFCTSGSEDILATIRCLNAMGASITYEANDYGGFEKVGLLGRTLPTSDTQITTQAGDVILYSGNQIVLFYGSNTWSYTRLGKMQYESLDELKSFLKAGEGNISVTLSL